MEKLYAKSKEDVLQYAKLNGYVAETPRNPYVCFSCDCGQSPMFLIDKEGNDIQVVICETCWHNHAFMDRIAP